MQLKVRRSQKTGGFSGSVIFCLDARVEFTKAEQDCLTRYKLANQVIYNSEAAKRALDQGELARDGSMTGSLKSLAFSALAAMKLNISIASLARGQHVECKSLDELLAAESAVIEACENLKAYLDTAATFDGREVLIDFSGEEAQVVAQAVTPTPMLAADPIGLPPTPAPAPAPLPQYELIDGEAVPVRPEAGSSGGPAADSWAAHAARKREAQAASADGTALFAVARPARGALSKSDQEIVKVLVGVVVLLIIMIWAIVQFG